jgi:hypothetical protein
LFLDGVERFIVVDMGLSIEVVVGDCRDGCCCIRGGGLRRHVWDRNGKATFPKDKTKIRAVLYAKK